MVDAVLSPLGEDHLVKIDVPKWQNGDVTPKDKLTLAKWVLLISAIIFILSGFAYLKWPNPGATIFDACKTILPSLSTLVLGYYFGQANSDP